VSIRDPAVNRLRAAEYRYARASEIEAAIVFAISGGAVRQPQRSK
jgi:hypothetical protein